MESDRSGSTGQYNILVALNNMELTTKDVVKTESILVGFDVSSAQVVGNIPLIICNLPHFFVEFVVIDALSIYNIIMCGFINWQHSYPLITRSSNTLPHRT